MNAVQIATSTLTLIAGVGILLIACSKRHRGVTR